MENSYTGVQGHFLALLKTKKAPQTPEGSPPNGPAPKGPRPGRRCTESPTQPSGSSTSRLRVPTIARL
ncbi:unnamed protein product [Nesidiocoris tenuis]|uniref:Uncharacterized protein n=1 Tax=Nesidiocoris tenuis TaxID=355587 RepID=A0A6H5H1I7_9HEMI|nr:unnamed protein product [Nesidiocoris tenuis]